MKSYPSVLIIFIQIIIQTRKPLNPVGEKVRPCYAAKNAFLQLLSFPSCEQINGEKSWENQKIWVHHQELDFVFKCETRNH